MPQDYKKTEPRRGRQCRCRGWFVAGLLLGVLLGGFVVWQWFTPRQTTAQASGKSTKKEPLVESSRFDFYKLLPEMEVPVSDPPAARMEPARQKSPAVRPSPRPPSQEKPGKRYRALLQIASFSNPADADRLKARLALIGIETRIERVRIDSGHSYHRVRSGPFSSERRLRRLQARLRKQGLKPIVIHSSKESK